MKNLLSASFGLSVLASTTVSGASLTALTTFGGGDGWRAPNEIVTGDTAGTSTGANYNYLGTGSLERGMSYNPATGNLVVVSRSASGNGIRILNGTTGADAGALNQGSAVIAGGTFTTNMVAIGGDGATYVANLVSPFTAATPTNFRIYRWANDAATPTVAYSGVPLPDGGRLGDSINVTGSGTSTQLVFGEGLGTGTTIFPGYAVFSTTDGSAFTGSRITFTGTPSTNGDQRLGVTFLDSNTVMATDGGLWFVSDFAGGSGTVTDSSATTSASERALDYTEFTGSNGVNKLLATIDTASSLVRVYDMTDPNSPVLLTSANATAGVLTANGNGVGSVQWGAVSGDTATLYAMSSNQGIQAFTFTVPEPSVAMLGLAALGGLLGRRRRS